MKSGGRSSQKRLARRILGQVFAVTYQTALDVNRPQQDYKMMIANLELTRLVDPQNANTLFALARAYALAARKKDAIEMLEQTARNGFTDCTQITGKSEWKSLRGEEQFQKIIRQVNCHK